MTTNKHGHRSRRSSRDGGATVPFWEDRTGVSPAVFLLASVVFGGGLLLGGSGGSFGDTVVQLLALPLIVLAAMQWSQTRLRGPDWAALAIMVGIALLGLVQLVPLPMSIWSALPAHADLLRDMQSVGVAPAWHSLSLNPYGTERAMQFTLPGIAMFLAVRWMSPRQCRVLLLILFLGALALLILWIALKHVSEANPIAAANEAIAQATLAVNTMQTSSYSGPLALAPPTPEPSITDLLLSHNRNHFATFLAMTFPPAVAMGLSLWVDRSSGKSKSSAAIPLLLTLVMVGLLAGMLQTHSRAALVLGGLALLGSLALSRHLGLNRMAIRSAIVLTAVGTLIAIQMAASVTLARVDASPGLGTRSQIHATTLQAARHFGPLGSGLGTFVEAYQQVDPVEGFWPEYINRAHGDYHELWLETGVPGAILILGFLAWFGWSSWRVWRNTRKTAALTLMARAASLSIMMVLLHSYVDYPLRKTAILVVFAMACAFLARTEVAVERNVQRKRIAKAIVPDA